MMDDFAAMIGDGSPSDGSWCGLLVDQLMEENPNLKDTGIDEMLMQFAATVFIHHASAFHWRIHKATNGYSKSSVLVLLHLPAISNFSNHSHLQITFRFAVQATLS